MVKARTITAAGRRLRAAKKAIRKWAAGDLTAAEVCGVPLSPCGHCGKPAKMAVIEHPRFFGRDAIRPPPGACSRRCYVEILVAEFGLYQVVKKFLPRLTG